jgi:protocatechuate 3,4-dioxygenase beta subunit
MGPDGPVTHLAITLSPPEANLNSLEPQGAATAVTDARGVFTFLGLTPGDYRLNARYGAGNEMTGEGRVLWAQDTVTIGDDDVRDLNVTMQPGVPVSGRVEFRTASGVAAKPAQRQVITLQPVRANAWRTLQGVVQPDGTFRTAGDPPGRYLVNASTPAGWYLHTMSLAGRPVPDETIDLGTSELSGLVITYGQATNRITGLATGSDGTPDPHAAVIVFAADTTAWREGVFTSSRRFRTAYTTSSGSFEIATMAPGDYYVAAIPRQFALNTRDPEVLERLTSGAARVRLGPEDTRDVRIRTIASVSR